MQTLSVELDEETLQALEVERSLIGFESRDAYVRWIIANRAAIEQETEMGDVLDAYSDRIAKLESRLESIESEQSSPGTSSVASGEAERSDDAETDSAATPDAAEAAGDTGSAAGSGGDTQPASSDGGWTESGADSTAGPATPVEPDEPRTETGDDAIDSMNLRPERVERIRDERLSDDAGDLGSVEMNRLDELSRRAVAKTREQLDRDVETGLEYRSSTSLADTDDDIRPGEDVTDLDALAVPGRSADLVERRQELIGVALAHLRDEGSAKKGDFVDALYEEYPAGYGSPGGWWRCLKKGLKQVDRVDGGDGSRIWRLTG